MSLTAVLIVAAGRGSRAGTSSPSPKQYQRLAGKSLLERCVDAFTANPSVGAIRVVIHPDDGDLYRSAVLGRSGQLLTPVEGGRTRQESVRLGLQSLRSTGVKRVLIHDAARPLIDAATISRVLNALDQAPGAIAAIPVVDTLRRSGSSGSITETVDRSGLWRAQTPQGFHFKLIDDAHAKAHFEGREDFTDDAQIAEWAGIPVVLVQGSEDNIKVTTPSDLVRAESMLAATAFDVRTGTGFDVHRFTAGDHVWLCGVSIPHTHALEGHSDADVGLHALTDAILGALGDGDIGQHFPPSDPKWKGAASHLFLTDAARRVRERGGLVSNADVTLLCEAPRIGPHRDAMRAAIAGILAIDVGRVGVKATTTEGLGFTGRREGIAAMATATLKLPA